MVDVTAYFIIELKYIYYFIENKLFSLISTLCLIFQQFRVSVASIRINSGCMKYLYEIEIDGMYVVWKLNILNANKYISNKGK